MNVFVGKYKQMLSISIFLIIGGVWAIIYFFDIFLRTCHNHPYIWLQNRLGTTIHLGYARWYTTSLNRIFQRIGNWKPKFLEKWFGFGAICALLLILPAIILLIITATRYFTNNNASSDQVLAPAFPGVNLPLNEVIYYLLTLLLCSIIHEFGHAAAAIREDVRVMGSGMFLLGVIPAAFVDLPVDHIRQLTPWQQLRIFCAGVWHNIALAIVAASVLATLPFTTLIAYQTGSAILVTSIQEGSPAAGRAGLVEGDQLISIGECPLYDVDRWYKCLTTVTSVGYCAEMNFVDSFTDPQNKNFAKQTDIIDCCPPNAAQNLCFRQVDTSNQHSYVCMPARQVLTQAPGTCSVSSDCLSSRYTCLYPSTDASTKLLQIKRQDKDDVLFLGHPGDLFYTVTVSNYIPKWTFVPARIPGMIEIFCRYLISFSGGLAVLNVVPCIALDGQWITQATIDLLLSNLIPNRNKRNRIYLFLMILGTILLSLNIILAVVTLM